MTRRRVWLAAELTLVVLAVAAYSFFATGLSPIPILLVVGGASLVYLLRSKDFDRKALWNAAAVPWWSILRLWLIAAVVLTLAIAWWQPSMLFYFPRVNITLWALVMVFYPLLSVYPQELIFRAFFAQRYRPLFGAGVALCVASALLFGYVHILFGNWIAVAFSTVGGWLFARRYAKTGSLLAASIEHSLYGCLIFTIGIGQFFYHAG